MSGSLQAVTVRESRCAAYIVLNRVSLGLSNERHGMATAEACDGERCSCVSAEICCIPGNGDQLVSFRGSGRTPHLFNHSSSWSPRRLRAGNVQWNLSPKSFGRFRPTNDGVRCHESKKCATPTD